MLVYDTYSELETRNDFQFLSFEAQKCAHDLFHT